MAIRQRIKRKVKRILKSIIDRLVDSDTGPFQAAEPDIPPTATPSSADSSTAQEEPRAADTVVEAGAALAQEEAAAPEMPSPSAEEDTHSLKEVAVSDQLAAESASTAADDPHEASDQAENIPEEPEQPAPEAETPAEPAEPKVLTEEEKKAAAAAKHWEKTRRGLLKKLSKEGGHLGLAELHDFSERRFFIGHQKFSAVMEGLVEEELVHYSLEDYKVTLSKKGEEYLNHS